MATAPFLPERFKAVLLAVAILLAFVIVPYLFWHGSWFGRPLEDRELDRYLSEPENPRQLQHALSQIADRIERGDPGIRRWYGPACDLSVHPVAQVRIMLAWTLGQDPGSELFHDTLRNLLQDRDFLVRRNAALSLVRFGDAGGLEELREMLLPLPVAASGTGVIRYQVEEGDRVEPGTTLFETSSGEDGEVISVLGGEVLKRSLPHGSMAQRGEVVLELSPDPVHAWEALRALALVGGPAELPLIEAFAGDPTLSKALRLQAGLTLTAIQDRNPGS